MLASRLSIAAGSSIRQTRTLATAVQAPIVGESSRRRFPKLEDGLTFDDFVSGEPLPEPEVVTLGNTKQ